MNRHDLGDTDIPFTLSDAHHPLSYALCYEDWSWQELQRYIGAEPSGETSQCIKLDAKGGSLHCATLRQLHSLMGLGDSELVQKIFFMHLWQFTILCHALSTVWYSNLCTKPSLFSLLLLSDRPHNPMINAGAIVTASLIKNDLRSADRFDYVRAPG